MNRYFDFDTLDYMADMWERGQDTIVLAIYVFVVYTLVKKFLDWDN